MLAIAIDRQETPEFMLRNIVSATTGPENVAVGSLTELPNRSYEYLQVPSAGLVKLGYVEPESSQEGRVNNRMIDASYRLILTECI